jgi:hypothetical protein
MGCAGAAEIFIRHAELSCWLQQKNTTLAAMLVSLHEPVNAGLNK